MLAGCDRLIPDGNVEKIWEGTITVLSLDVLRATERSRAMDAFMEVRNAALRRKVVCLSNRICSGHTAS